MEGLVEGLRTDFGTIHLSPSVALSLPQSFFTSLLGGTIPFVWSILHNSSAR